MQEKTQGVFLPAKRAQWRDGRRVLLALALPAMVCLVFLFQPLQAFAADGSSDSSAAIGVQTPSQPASTNPDPVISGCARDRQLRERIPFQVGRSSVPILDQNTLHLSQIPVDPTTQMGMILHYYSPACQKWWVSTQLNNPPVTSNWVLSTELDDNEVGRIIGQPQGTFGHIHGLMTDSSTATGTFLIQFADRSTKMVTYSF